MREWFGWKTMWIKGKLDSMLIVLLFIEKKLRRRFFEIYEEIFLGFQWIFEVRREFLNVLESVLLTVWSKSIVI